MRDPYEDCDEDEWPVHEVGDPATQRIRLLAQPCDTCIIFPDDRMHLGQGRTDFIAEAVAKDSFVICHDTTYDPDVSPAICRGFYNAHRRDTLALRLLDHFGLAQEVAPPVGEK